MRERLSSLVAPRAGRGTPARQGGNSWDSPSDQSAKEREQEQEQKQEQVQEQEQEQKQEQFL